MLYSLFIYQRKSGLFLYGKSFYDFGKGQLELFSSFFSVMQTILREMELKGESELSTIDFGQYSIYFKSIPDTASVIVIIAEKEDQKRINKLIPKIFKVISEHKELFIDWVADIGIFQILDQPLTRLIYSVRKLVNGESRQKNDIAGFKDLMSKYNVLSDEKCEYLIKEKNFLIGKLENIDIFQKKLILIKKIIEISTLLKDDQIVQEFKEKLRLLKNDIKDKTYKAQYYLENLKAALTFIIYQLGNKSMKEGHYGEVYSNMFSFSSKLKNITEPRIWKKYHDIARKLSNKDSLTDDKFREIIAELSKMEHKIENYIEWEE